MKRADKADRIVEILQERIPNPPIPLDHRNEFELLVAVLLSAQTTDERVNMITPDLFREAPTPQAMHDLGTDRIQELIRTVGLAPQKSKALSGLAKMLVELHDHEVPRTFEELEALPGVGHKTASVVMAQAFGVPAFPVDTHIHRLAARWGLSDGKSVEKTERDLKRAFDKELWNDLHLQIILFGRQYCPARGHDLSKCPICSWAASKTRIAEEAKKNTPVAKKRSAKRRASKKKSAAKKRRSKSSPKVTARSR